MNQACVAYFVKVWRMVRIQSDMGKIKGGGTDLFLSGAHLGFSSVLLTFQPLKRIPKNAKVENKNGPNKFSK